MVRVLSAVLERERPDAVFAPTRWISIRRILELIISWWMPLGDYLERTGRGPLPFFETEFWHQNLARI